MRKFIDVTGKTEDEAISKALAQLNMDRDDVSVEILERAKSGFLGIGSCPAKVRVTYEEVEEAPAVVEEVEQIVKEEPKAAAPKAAAPKAEKTERQRNEKKQRTKAPKAEKKPEVSKTAAPVEMGEEANDAKAEQFDIKCVFFICVHTKWFALFKGKIF